MALVVKRELLAKFVVGWDSRREIAWVTIIVRLQ